MNKEKTPYLIENKERDTFTFYVKGTKPYLDLEKEIDQLTNNWNELEEWLQNEYNDWSTVDDEIIRAEARQCIEVLDKMKEIKERNNEVNK